MEKVILFKGSNGLSEKIEERLINSKLDYEVVPNGLNFDLGNVELPAIFYSGKYYSGNEGLRDFKKDILYNLEYSAMEIRNNF